jgi:hypothetical protein
MGDRPDARRGWPCQDMTATEYGRGKTEFSL